MRINSFFQGIKGLSRDAPLEKHTILLQDILMNKLIAKYVSMFYVDKLPEPIKGLKIKRRFGSLPEGFAQIFIDRKNNILYGVSIGSLYKLDLSTGNVTKLFSYAGKWNLYPLKSDFSLWISRDCPSGASDCSDFVYNIYDLNGNLVKKLYQSGANPGGNCCNHRLFFVNYVDYNNNYVDFITNAAYNSDYRIFRLNLKTGYVSTIYSIPNSNQMDIQFTIKIKDKYYMNYGFPINHFQVFYWNSSNNATGVIEDKGIAPGHNVLVNLAASQTQLILGNPNGWSTQFHNLFYIDLVNNTYKLLDVYDENGNKIDLSSTIFSARNYAVTKDNTIFAMTNLSTNLLVELEII